MAAMSYADADLTPYAALIDEAERLLPEQLSVEQAIALLDDATEVVVRDAPATSARLRALTRVFKGVPASPNPWRILGMERNEVRFTQVLSWLMSPLEDHGIGDLFLRGFLLRLASPRARQLARQNAQLEVTAHPEFQFVNGIPDLVLVFDDLVVVVEVKIDAPLHSIRYDKRGERVPQTTAYRRDLDRPEVHRRLAMATHRDVDRIHRADRAFAFVAPTAHESNDSAYSFVAIGQLTWLLAQIVDGQHLSAAQHATLRGVLTQMLVASGAGDTLALLQDTRIHGLHGAGHRPGPLALDGQELLARWTDLHIGNHT